MRDVSYALPAIHPTFAIPVSEGTANHTAGFTESAATEEAHERTLRAARALAMTALDLAGRPDLLAHARAEFTREMG